MKKFLILMTNNDAAWETLSEAETKGANGAFTTTTEPYLPANRAIAGFYLIEAESLTEATQWAERCRFIEGANIVHELWE